MLHDSQNIILIGMPGVGKSTVGVLLAKETRRSFVDTDVLIQAGEGRTLQEIIDALGNDAFCRLEEQYMLCLDLRSHVIATGGSVVYSEAAMAALKQTGPIVYLELSLELLSRRISNQATRGIVIAKSQTLADLYARRTPLYRKYADLTIPCAGLTQDQVVARIVKSFQ
jgi:shikimate kinase